MENKYNQRTVLLTRLSDAPLHLFSQTIPCLHVCSVLHVLMERLCEVNVNTALHKSTIQQWFVIGKR